MLLIFDLDGTLFQAKPVVLLAVRRLLYQLGVPEPDESAILKNAGRGAIDMLIGVLPEGIEPAAVMPDYYKQMRAAILERGALFDGVRNTLEQLYEDGHELVICSNSPMIYIALVLEHTGIAGLFTNYYSTEGYKSKSELVSKLIRPGVPAVVIGDAHGDISAAHENGLRAIAAAYGYGNKEMLKPADFFARTPEEIADRVRDYITDPRRQERM